MTGLPYLADNIKSLLKWSAIGFASLFTLWILWLIFSFAYKLIFPPPAAPATAAFGKLRQPFSFNSTFSGNTFSLDTPGKSIISTSNLIKVYEIPEIEGEFASLDNAKKVARAAGLDSEPQQLSDKEWRFTNKKNPNKSLKFNIITHNFTYKYDWISDPKSLEGVFKTNDAAMVSKAKTLLNNFKALKDDIKNGTTRVTFWKIVSNDRNQVGSYSEANAVMVEFFRKGIDDQYKFIEINPNRSQVNVLISPNSSSDLQLLELNFTHFDYNKEKLATYPEKTGNQAYEDLKKGKAYIAIGDKEAFQSISISKTSISYLNPYTDQRTLQPVIVFEGNGLVKDERKNFMAFVPLVREDYLR